MNFVAVAIVSAIIVLGQPFNKRLIGLNRILLCLNHSSQITRWIWGPYGFWEVHTALDGPWINQSNREFHIIHVELALVRHSGCWN